MQFPYPITAVHSKVLPFIHEAGAIAKEAFQKGIEVSLKGGDQISTDILTKTDLEIDKFLRKNLHKKFSDVGFITEENESSSSEEEFFWVIDPIDGTANFAHEIPIFGISLALWGSKGPVYGIISFPMQGKSGEIVHAIAGGGVFLNGKRFIRKRKTKSKHLAVLVNQVGASEKKLAVHQKIIEFLPFPYNYRCTTYHLAMTALGRFDCVVATNLALWDFAAGIVLVQEAGLTVEFVTPFPNINGDSVREYKHSFVVAKQEIAKKMAPLLRNL